VPSSPSLHPSRACGPVFDPLADDHDIRRLSEHACILALLRRKFSARHACTSADPADPAAPDAAAQRGAGDLPPNSGRGGEGGVALQELNVFVVEALRFEGGVWACYDNFLEGTKSGEPARGYLRTVRNRPPLLSLLKVGIGIGAGALLV
jgi:hypothetical protein